MAVDRTDYKLSKSVAQEVCNKFDLGEVRSVESLRNKGINNYAFVINNTYVVRISRRDTSKSLDIDRYIFRKLSNKYPDFPIPHIVGHDNSLKIIPKAYHILTKIHGISLDDAWKTISDSQKLQISKNLGTIVGKIHNIHFRSIGYFDGKKVEPYNSWTVFLKEDYDHNILILRKFNAVDADFLKQIERYYYNKQKLLDVKFTPCLIHHDLHFDNFTVDHNTISGVFDFEWAFSGHNEYELAKIDYSLFQSIPELRKPFFEEYLKFQKITPDYEERKKMYRFLNLLMMIAGIYEDNEPQDPNKYFKELKPLIT